MILENIKTLNGLSFEQNRAQFADLYNKIKLFQLENSDEWTKLGFVECFLTNKFFLPKDGTKIFATYDSFQRGKVSGLVLTTEITRCIERNFIFFDEVNKVYFLANMEAKGQLILDLNSSAMAITAKSSLGNMHSSKVSRDVLVFSTFPTYFVDHSGANKKGYKTPQGEAFGIEIEMKFPNVFSKLRFSNFVGTNFRGWITERDGSLEDKGNSGDGGLELVSQPLNYKTLCTQLDPILTKARSENGIGHDAGVFYGIHINTNIYGDNQERTAKRLICLINDPVLRNFWEIMSRRRGSKASEEYCQFKNVTFDTCLRTESDGHYRATYYRTNNGVPTNCVEVRIFRSNLKLASVKISLEIVKLTLDYSLLDNSNIEDYSAFREFILTNGSEDLKKYIYASKAINCLDNASNNFTTKKMGADLKYFA